MISEVACLLAGTAFGIIVGWPFSPPVPADVRAGARQSPRSAHAWTAKTTAGKRSPSDLGDHWAL
ncbi:hypothetical protein KHQ06_01675 [Nocardia tengchongensis]|uniref:Uncharacterized protein n=1 Tax=Nocardia tengchongensis TaxID=2055889 RepID=A0ABX8CPR6_9NOCA|nr:hypothetical protein [Nocardia tengchongensis]QVI21898.1 hypothetical protein KHQ06_01675 [Nocardia tengchongensis]